MMLRQMRGFKSSLVFYNHQNHITKYKPVYIFNVISFMHIFDIEKKKLRNKV